MATYVLCLGVDTYEDENISPLKCAERDALSLCTLFNDQFKFEAAVMTDRKTEDIEKRIRKLGEKLRPDDTFIFYFSGHGKAHHDDQYFLLPGCAHGSLVAAKGVTGGVLSWNSLNEITTGKNWQGVQRVFIVDACRTPLFRDKSGSDVPAFDGSFLLRNAFGPNRRPVPQGVQQVTFINSCDEGTSAMELPGMGAGVFTAALIEGLKDALKSGKDVLLHQGFMDEIAARMKKMASDHGLGTLPQAPVFKGESALLMQGSGAGARLRDQRKYQLACARGTEAAFAEYVDQAGADAQHVDDALKQIEALRQAGGAAVNFKDGLGYIQAAFAERDAAQKERDGLAAELGQCEAKIEELEGECRMREARFEEMRSEKESVEADLDGMRKLFGRQERELAAQEEVRALLAAKVGQLSKELGEEKAVGSELVLELEKYKSEHHKIRAEFAKDKAEWAKFANVKTALNQEIEKKNQSIFALEAELNALQRRFEKQEATLLGRGKPGTEIDGENEINNNQAPNIIGAKLVEPKLIKYIQVFIISFLVWFVILILVYFLGRNWIGATVSPSVPKSSSPKALQSAPQASSTAIRPTAISLPPPALVKTSQGDDKAQDALKMASEYLDNARNIRNIKDADLARDVSERHLKSSDSIIADEARKINCEARLEGALIRIWLAAEVTDKKKIVMLAAAKDNIVKIPVQECPRIKEVMQEINSANIAIQSEKKIEKKNRPNLAKPKELPMGVPKNNSKRQVEIEDAWKKPKDQQPLEIEGPP
jgi:hypothetical protein